MIGRSFGVGCLCLVSTLFFSEKAMCAGFIEDLVTAPTKILPPEIRPPDPIDSLPGSLRPYVPRPGELPPAPPLAPDPRVLLNSCAADLLHCPQSVFKSIPADDVQLVNACLADLVRCPDQVIKRLPAYATRQIIEKYKNGLRQQAAGKWQSFPSPFVATFKDDYPNIDLNQVRYATGINTIHGQAITFGYEIFFPSNVDISTHRDKKLMLHELQHTSQYAAKGGEAAFISEYLLHATGQGISRQSVNIHDYIPVENDAIEKSRQVLEKFGWQLHYTNRCKYSVQLAVYYESVNGVWRPEGWWNVGPGVAISLREGDRLLHTKNNTVYFYASTNQPNDPNIVWEGDDEINFQGKKFKFVKQIDTTEDYWASIVGNCDGF